MTDLEERLRGVAGLDCVSAERCSVLLAAADVLADLAEWSIKVSQRVAALTDLAGDHR